MSRPTVSDIGRAAGVSLATVDRVLNGRPGVRQTTIDRVHSAIKEIGYVRDVAAANLARSRQYRFVFVLPDSETSFLSTLGGAVEAMQATTIVDRTEVEVVRVPAADPHALVRTLRGMEGSHTDGIAILADETPQLRDEIARLRQRGVHVVTIVSDLPSTERTHFIGIDGVAAGRTAAVLIGRFATERRGSVAVVANSLQSRETLERRLGFDEVMVRRFPHLHALPTMEVRDGTRTMRDTLRAVLRRDVTGLYCLGSGHRALLEVLRDRADRPVTVAHDLTETAAEALRRGAIDAVISQDVEHIVRSAVRVLRAECDRHPIVRSQERIRIEIVLHENLPDRS